MRPKYNNPYINIWVYLIPFYIACLHGNIECKQNCITSVRCINHKIIIILLFEFRNKRFENREQLEEFIGINVFYN